MEAGIVLYDITVGSWTTDIKYLFTACSHEIFPYTEVYITIAVKCVLDCERNEKGLQYGARHVSTFKVENGDHDLYIVHSFEEMNTTGYLSRCL